MAEADFKLGAAVLRAPFSGGIGRHRCGLPETRVGDPVGWDAKLFEGCGHLWVLEPGPDTAQRGIAAATCC